MTINPATRNLKQRVRRLRKILSKTDEYYPNFRYRSLAYQLLKHKLQRLEIRLQKQLDLLSRA